MIAAILGFGLGGVLVAMVGVKGGFYLDSFSFLVSGIMIIFISSKVGVIIHRARIFELGREVLEVIKKSVISEIKDGIVYLIKQRGIRLIVNIFFLLGAVAGTMYVVMIVFIQQTFGTVTKDLGLFVMFFGFGLFAGSLLYGRFGQATSHIKTIFLSLFSAGILLSLFTFILNTTPNFFIAAILSFLFGVVIAPILTAGNTLIHRVSSDEMRGKVFSNLEIVMHLAFLIFMLISSKLAEYIDRFWILLILGIICAIIGLIGLFNTKRVRTAYD
jgi:MFS family permease